MAGHGTLKGFEDQFLFEISALSLHTEIVFRDMLHYWNIESSKTRSRDRAYLWKKGKSTEEAIFCAPFLLCSCNYCMRTGKLVFAKTANYYVDCVVSPFLRLTFNLFVSADWSFFLILSIFLSLFLFNSCDYVFHLHTYVVTPILILSLLWYRNKNHVKPSLASSQRMNTSAKMIPLKQGNHKFTRNHFYAFVK